MSLWICPECKTLTAPEVGLCPRGCGVRTEYASVEMTPEQQRAAARFVQLFTTVPMTDEEQNFPDPDYGL